MPGTHKISVDFVFVQSMLSWISGIKHQESWDSTSIGIGYQNPGLVTSLFVFLLNSIRLPLFLAVTLGLSCQCGESESDLGIVNFS